MIYMFDTKGKHQADSLLAAVLGCPEDELSGRTGKQAPVISIVGGGGKTTCLMTMAGEYRERGIPSVVATTTHMQMPFDEFLLDTEDMTAFEEKMAKEGQVWLGRRIDPQYRNPQILRDKSRSLSVGFVRQVSAESGCPVLIEADGAKRLPCKVPADHEPVIIPETTVVVNVYGLDTLGRPFEETVFRPELACSLLCASPSDPVTEEDLTRLALMPQAGLKDVGGDMDYVVVFNKADTKDLKERGFKMAQILVKKGVKRVLVTAGLNELV